MSDVEVARNFIACINAGDVEGLGRLMTPDHELIVFDEAPVVGRDANIEAWHGYASSWPEYLIYPRQIVESDGAVAVLGHTTGSHLGLPDEEESLLTLIWIAEIEDGLVQTWRLEPDDAEHRTAHGLSA